jgi:hypothetical protein
VDWDAFGQETNNTQRSRIEGMRQKLHHYKNKGLEVSRDAWRKVKVEKGTPSGLGGATHFKWVNSCASLFFQWYLAFSSLEIAKLSCSENLDCPLCALFFLNHFILN